MDKLTRVLAMKMAFGTRLAKLDKIKNGAALPFPFVEVIRRPEPEIKSNLAE
jgi:hypothetical protein